VTTAISTIDDYRARFQPSLLERLPDHLGRLAWDHERIATWQRDRLRKLLRRAISSSPFHARRLQGIDPETFELADLPKLPVMTKEEMMDRFDDVVTDRRLSLGLLESTLAQTSDEPVPLFSEYVCQASGGSSGCRGVFVLDLEAMTEFSASLLRPAFVAAADARVTAIVAAPSAVHATGIPSKLMKGGPMQIHTAPASLPIPELCARLDHAQPDVLLGYPSMLARLAAEQQAGRLRIAPKLVRTTSETLLAEHRRAIREAFGAPVMDTFGSSEGLVGSSLPDDPVLVFASDLCVVELVDEANRPVKPGTPSAKLLVTNLYNLAQPLIRYVLEDSFVEQPLLAEHGHFRAIVHGRADEVLHYADVDVHPIVVRSVFVKTPEVIDYQVRQTARGVNATVVASQQLDADGLSQRLRKALHGAGLAEPDVHIDVAAALERNAGTGKLRRVIPIESAAA
jgi:phenylacetate-CoA ligase